MPAALTAWLVLVGGAWAQQADTSDAEDPGPVSVALSSDAVLRLGGYLDVGWFDAQGDGAAYIPVDSTGDHGTAWTFVGDPWANPVNSLGDPADLGLEYRSTLDRLDSIDSDGNPSFVVNQWHQTVAVAVTDRLVLRTAIDFAPRTGTLGRLGDLAWVDYAYAEWIPSLYSDWRVTVGKVESSFGEEYRYRQSPDRHNISPTLLARYTTGTPVGIKARGSVLDQTLWINASLTNDGSATERFGHFARDIDDNGVPTGTTRLALRRKMGSVAMELGGSAQLGYRGPDTLASMVGGDLSVNLWLVQVRGKLLRVRYPRAEITQDLLVADAWSVETSALLFSTLRPLIRVDHRRADMTTGPNQYLSNVLRTAAAVRVNAGAHGAFKAEYLHLDERGAESIEIPNDVFTTSAVLEF